MLSKPFVTTLIVMLILVYMGALAVSTAHLSQLYALFNAGLPYSVSIGLAVALEAAAFLFSIISTSLGKKAGPWTAWASTSALLLVWAGNGYAMLLAAPTQPWYIVLGASCFVPVCTLFIGKVLGALFGLLNRLDQPELAARREAALANGTVGGLPVTATLDAVATPVTQQTVQDRLVVTATSPVRRPLPAEKPAIADESPVPRPGTSAAAHFIHAEVAAPLPKPADPPASPTGTGDSGMPVLNTELENTPPEAATPDPRSLAAETDVPLTGPTIPPTPPADTGASNKPVLNPELNDTSPADATPDPRLLLAGVTEETYRNMSVAWTTKRKGQQEGGRRPSLTPEQELTLTLLRRYDRRWQVIVEEFSVSERRARGIAGEVKAELTERGLW